LAAIDYFDLGSFVYIMNSDYNTDSS
jgi:hypothetical protein